MITKHSETNYKKVGFVDVFWGRKYVDEVAQNRGFDVVDIYKNTRSPDNLNLYEAEMNKIRKEFISMVSENGRGFCEHLKQNQIEAVIIETIYAFQDIEQFISCVLDLVCVGLPIIFANEEIDTSKIQDLEVLLISLRSLNHKDKVFDLADELPYF
ncbi:hypothetical protein HLK66_25045 [Niallia circulans]|uniref:hypothetical protein n=1 Tax=Niallia circulans TaxID=1397 RepID=UPI00148FF580|nr:hypothetical protein [Niallia circulans]QJX64595.1 hypothetical protein HLK66_25045 [Niallia circulans]